MEEQGSLEKPEALKQKLKSTFQERAKNGVFEENSSRVVKRVIIRMPDSIKYHDALKVINTVKESDANPIALMPEKTFQKFARISK